MVKNSDHFVSTTEAQFQHQLNAAYKVERLGVFEGGGGGGVPGSSHSMEAEYCVLEQYPYPLILA